MRNLSFLVLVVLAVSCGGKPEAKVVEMQSGDPAQGGVESAAEDGQIYRVGFHAPFEITENVQRGLESLGEGPQGFESAVGISGALKKPREHFTFFHQATEKPETKATEVLILEQYPAAAFKQMAQLVFSNPYHKELEEAGMHPVSAFGGFQVQQESGTPVILPTLSVIYGGKEGGRTIHYFGTLIASQALLWKQDFTKISKLKSAPSEFFGLPATVVEEATAKIENSDTFKKDFESSGKKLRLTGLKVNRPLQAGSEAHYERIYAFAGGFSVSYRFTVQDNKTVTVAKPHYDAAIFYLDEGAGAPIEEE